MGRRRRAHGHTRGADRVPADLLADEPVPGVGLPDGLRALVPCVICGCSGAEEVAIVHLPHGIHAWLCRTHRAPNTRVRSRGQWFTTELARAWASLGALNRRRTQSLETLRRALTDQTRFGPGSYSWPVLRREAERRFSAGERPFDVIRDLRAQYGDADAIPPSARTMRRWFAQSRWLVRTLRPAVVTAAGARGRTGTPRASQRHWRSDNGWWSAGPVGLCDHPPP